ncbi:tetratricopeptide repeat protein [Opitutus sp. ER46]|uniref:tetratricopeptide repeat protein n=1 Tax=Opitutus sp. ER46 TaxID=2161864 RepID=UPI0011B27004|nr:tetratricopeptide repeat protein [Opitutus sp. ER46]
MPQPRTSSRDGRCDPPRRIAFWTAAALIVVAALAAYHNSFQVPFVFDDEPAILANPTLQTLPGAWVPPPGSLTVSGRPLLNFSFALNHAVSGTAVWSYHALNLLIHATAGITLWWVVAQTLRGPRLARRYGDRAEGIALGAALLWVLHPLQTESVTYTVQRAESLCGLFVLLTLACFIRATRTSEPARGWLAAAAGSAMLGVLTKEVAVVAPLLVLLYERTFVAGNWRGAWAARRWFYAALLASWVVLGALVVSTHGRDGTFDFSLAAWWRYDLTQFSALSQYLRLAVWPAPLTIEYGTFWVTRAIDVWPHVPVAVGFIVATLVALRRWPMLGFLGAWFFVTLAPSSLPPGTIQMIVEHRMYLPLAAVAVLGVLLLDAVLGGRRALWLGLAVAVALGGLTARRNQDYATPVRLFEDTVAKRPQNARAMALLAEYLRVEGQREEARQWLERSLAIDPSVAAVWSNLGAVSQELGDAARAAECYAAAVARKPGDADLLNNLGTALVLAGRSSEGIRRLQEAQRIAPDSSRVLFGLAHALADAGRLTEAAEQFAALAKVMPGNVAVHANHGAVLMELGRPDEAAAALSAAVQLAPNDAELHNRLGMALAQSGHRPEALAAFEAAVRINPAHAEARANARRLSGGRQP